MAGVQPPDPPPHPAAPHFVLHGLPAHLDSAAGGGECEKRDDTTEAAERPHSETADARDNVEADVEDGVGERRGYKAQIPITI